VANPPEPDKVKLKKKRSGRFRRMLGWTLLTLGLLVAGVWFASRWWEVRKLFNGWSIGVYEGNVSVGVGKIPPGDLVIERTYLERWVFWNGWDYGDQGVGQVWMRGFVSWVEIPTPGSVSATVTLWPTPLLLWAPAALLLRSGMLAQKRAMTGSCAKCGYSLAGLVADAACPECGKASTITRT
jgi:hypothetical protein